MSAMSKNPGGLVADSVGDELTKYHTGLVADTVGEWDLRSSGEPELLRDRSRDLHCDGRDLLRCGRLSASSCSLLIPC